MSITPYESIEPRNLGNGGRTVGCDEEELADALGRNVCIELLTVGCDEPITANCDEELGIELLPVGRDETLVEL